MKINGTLSFATISGGGFTVDGDPIQPTIVWSSAVDCLIITNTKNNKGTYQNEKFTISAYEVHIEAQAFTAETIKLTNDRGVYLGEFKVQNIEFLDAVQRVKIIV